MWCNWKKKKFFSIQVSRLPYHSTRKQSCFLWYDTDPVICTPCFPRLLIITFFVRFCLYHSFLDCRWWFEWKFILWAKTKVMLLSKLSHCISNCTLALYKMRSWQTTCIKDLLLSLYLPQCAFHFSSSFRIKYLLHSPIPIICLVLYKMCLSARKLHSRNLELSLMLAVPWV